ncbi:MAG: hypothetical protein WD116_05565 [Chloroflexota bacterium]
MRSMLGLGASALAALAAVVAAASDPYIVTFFIGLTFVGAVEAAAARPPFKGWRRFVARGAALFWLLAAFWVGVLLLMYTAACACSSPEPGPTVLILGVPATVYHLIGLYGGVALVMASAFGPDRWGKLSQRRPTASGS